MEVRRHVTARLGRGSSGYRIFGFDALQVQHGVPCNDMLLPGASKRMEMYIIETTRYNVFILSFFGICPWEDSV